jgi:DUF4097 and DUF4098 domain-containing protein YvlB
MNKTNTKTAVLNLLLALTALVVIGCNINIGGCSMGSEKFERTEEHTVPVQGIEAIDVDTLFGSVTVTGAPTDECHIEAELTARAPSLEEAEQIAEQTKVVIEPDGATLKIFVEHPHLKSNRSVGVSFNISMPKSVAAEVRTSYGSVKLANIEANVKAGTSFAAVNCSDVTGQVDLKTSYGSIKCENIESESVKAHTSFSSINCRDVAAPVDLKTSYGSINCKNLTADNIKAHSSFGSVDIECSDRTDPQLIADISTSYGSIEFKIPDGFAGTVDAKTSFGSIKTSTPITVSGEIDKDKMRGTVGSGSGQLKLKTSFGSIKIK